MNCLVVSSCLALGLFPLLAIGACGGGTDVASQPIAPKSAAAPAPASTDGERQATPLVVQGAAVAGSPLEAADAETPDQIYARVRSDLVACYEQGRKALPNMTSGRITLNVSIDGAGKPTCIVASDDTGLSQSVEDCMSARMGRESFKSNGATWATELPLLVKDGKVSLGPPATNAPALETIETHGLPDSAENVVAALLPQLHKCTEVADAKTSLRVMHVGARVAKDGRVECAIASSPSPLPTKMRDCAAGTLVGTKFPPPKSDFGLVSVPVKILGRK